MTQFEVLAFRYAVNVAVRLQRASPAATDVMLRMGAPELPTFEVAFAPHKVGLKNVEWVSTGQGVHCRTDFYVVASVAARKVAVMHMYLTTNYDDGTFSKKSTSSCSRLLERELRPVAGDLSEDLEVHTAT